MDKKIKLLLTDFDGVMTDGAIYYDERGAIAKRFHVHDGMGLEILAEAGVQTGILTTDDSPIVKLRAQRLKIKHVLKDVAKGTKLAAAQKLCAKLKVGLDETAYMGDDVNCYDLLSAVGHPACPADAQGVIRAIPGIFIAKLPGGNGALREWINHLLTHGLCATAETLPSLAARNFAPKQ